MFRRSQPAAAPMGVGSLLNNRYRLVEQLGKGGSGIVYKAEDEQLARVVAIKVLLAEGGMAADRLERFRSEARSVARLNHPNVVTLYDYAEQQGQPYLVLEYIPGQDLWALDNSYSPNLVPMTESLRIIDGVLAALEYSHQHTVIHRDLKPENVMITPDGQVKVMDFGLARLQGQSRLTQEGLVAGTASYLAPELAMGEAGDHRADLYAIGVMMYELLAGRCPFSGADPLSVISQHIHAPVVPPQRFNPDLPDELQVIILKLLAKHPEERYSAAAEVRRDLAPVVEGLKAGGVKADGSQVKQAPVSESTTPHQTLLERISRGKMVGREEEVEELKRRWDRVRMGAENVEPLLLISGEGGVGKTRLLRELQVYTGLRDGYVLHSVAHEQQSGTPYATLASALRNYVREQPMEVLRRQAPGFIAGEVVKLVPQLAEKIGYIPPNPPLEPSAERARLLDQVSRFLLNMAYERPTLLLLDDIHFADPGSLDILDTLIHRAAGSSLLVAGAYRDVALTYSNPINRLIASLATDHLVYNIPLRRLPQAAAGRMLLNLLGDTVSEAFIDFIYQTTEGNPLFVEEVIKGLTLDGQIIFRQGRWEQRPSGRLNVPGSIKAVLGGRLDRVQKQSLELLQLAAVVGRNFNLDLLTAASPYDGDVIQQAVAEALHSQLIELQPDGGPAVPTGNGGSYQFQHALIRETLYEELRPLRRRQLHRRIAGAMERLLSQQATNPAVLARHLIAGAQDEKAVPYLRQAGDAARRLQAYAEALDYLSQAIEILEDTAPDLTGEELRLNLADQFDLLNQRRSVLYLTGERERELTTLEAMRRVAEALADQTRGVEVMSRLATHYWEVGRLNQAEEIARRGLELARQNKNRPGEQYCLEQIARVLWTRRDVESMAYATQALVIAQELGDRRREGRLTELIGHVYADTLHDPRRAALYFNQALAICRETGNQPEEAWTLWGMGGLALFVNDYTAALQHYNQARQISEQIGATLQVGWDLYHAGDAWYNLGDYQQAMELYQQSQVVFNTSQHLRGKIYALISLGLVFIVLDKRDEAGTYLEQAMRQAEERQDLTLMFRSYQALSAYYRYLGGEENLSYAVRLSNRVLKLAAEGGHFEHELLGYYLRAAAFQALGEVQEALKSSQAAIGQLERLTYIHSPQISEAEIYLGHSRILAAAGQAAGAQAYRQKAHAEILRQADLIHEAQLRRDFLRRVPLNRAILAAGSAG